MKTLTPTDISQLVEKNVDEIQDAFYAMLNKRCEALYTPGVVLSPEEAYNLKCRWEAEQVAIAIVGMAMSGTTMRNVGLESSIAMMIRENAVDIAHQMAKMNVPAISADLQFFDFAKMPEGKA